MKVEIMYFGRPSEYLLMSSERMDIPYEILTFDQVLNNLRMRNARWAYELDDSCVFCTINRKSALPPDALQDRDEIGIFSRKSLRVQ